MKTFLLKSLLIFSLALVSLICLVVAHSSYKKVNELETWQKTAATVISATTEEELRRKGTTFCPKVVVSYELHGQQYVSKLELGDGPCGPVQQNIDRAIETFNAGKKLEVFVNPSKPSQVRAGAYSLGMLFYVTSIVGVLALVGIVLVSFLLPANKYTVQERT